MTKICRPARGLWMTMPLWTIAEQVYDIRATRRTNVRKAGSSQAGRHPIGVRRHHRAPDSSRFHTLSNRLVDGPPVELRETVVGRQAVRIGRTERLFQAGPE